MSEVTEPTQITFEAGYERLKSIAERIDEEEVPVSEMCNLFAEGKGLERALGDYLDRQQARLEEIERGDGIQAFRIIEASGEPSDGGPVRDPTAARAPTGPSTAAEAPAQAPSAGGPLDRSFDDNLF